MCFADSDSIFINFTFYFIHIYIVLFSKLNEFHQQIEHVSGFDVNKCWIESVWMWNKLSVRETKRVWIHFWFIFFLFLRMKKRNKLNIYTILSEIFFRRNRYYKGQGKLKTQIKIHKNLKSLHFFFFDDVKSSSRLQKGLWICI